MSEFVEIGRMIRTHGLKGELKAKIDPHMREVMRSSNAIFIKEKKGHRPFFIETMQINLIGIVRMKLEEVNSVDEAKALCGLSIFLDKKILKQEAEESLQWMIGFAVEDERLGAIGKIENIYLLPTHPVGALMIKGKEVLFPMVDDVVMKIEKRKKILRVNLPKGLIETYTG